MRSGARLPCSPEPGASGGPGEVLREVFGCDPDGPTDPAGPQCFAFDKAADGLLRAAAALRGLFDREQPGGKDFAAGWIFYFHRMRALWFQEHRPVTFTQGRAKLLASGAAGQNSGSS